MENIPISMPYIGEKEKEYVLKALESGWVSSIGEYIDTFEKKFAKYCDTKFALTTSNGTTALHLALAAFGISSGDEVIVPDFTFVATANAVKYTGANVVFADIDKDSLCICVDSIKKLITKKTKAIIPVHIYGHPANMDEINNIAKENNLIVIEDAAEAHGAEWNGKKVGGLGDVGIFSFYGNKIITSGEGGMITTNDENIYSRLRFLRDHAMSKEKRYWHTDIGFNYRMTNIQAALGLAQLESIDKFVDKKRFIYKWYKDELSGIENIRLNYEHPLARNVYWMVCLELKDYSEEKRAEFMQRIKELGIDSRPYFYPISDMPMYSGVNCDTKITHIIYKTGVNLPSYYTITQEQVKYICRTIRNVL